MYMTILQLINCHYLDSSPVLLRSFRKSILVNVPSAQKEKNHVVIHNTGTPFLSCLSVLYTICVCILFHFLSQPNTIPTSDILTKIAINIFNSIRYPAQFSILLTKS